MWKGNHDIADIPVAAAIMGPLLGTQAIGKGRLDYSRYSHTATNPDAFLDSPPRRRKAGADSDLAAALIQTPIEKRRRSRRSVTAKGPV